MIEKLEYTVIVNEGGFELRNYAGFNIVQITKHFCYASVFENIDAEWVRLSS